MHETRQQRVVVIGGGVSGLAAAFHLRQLAARRDLPLRVLLVERTTRLGGCIETQRKDGFTMEMGADSLLTEKLWGIGLLRRLGLESELSPMRPEYKGACVVRGRRLVRIPDDFRLFTPTSIASVFASGLFSPPALARIALEPLVRARRSREDESLASFVTRRFGREVLDRLAQPLVGGIYSGDPERLSMRATLPQFCELERRHGSLFRAFRTTDRAASPAKAPSTSMPRLVSLRGGLGTLVERLENEMRDAIRMSADVVALQRIRTPRSDEGWSVQTADGTSFEADAVICASPAHASSRMLTRAQPQLAELLASIKYHSVATITLGYDADGPSRIPRRYGFVVPFVERRSITAATIVNQKYPGRAPIGSVLIRTFVGGALQSELLELRDDELTRAAAGELRDLLGIVSEPRFAIVRRWPQALPEYAVGHVKLVDEIERLAGALPRFALASSAYRGVGIPNCIHGGEIAAEHVLSRLFPRA